MFYRRPKSYTITLQRAHSLLKIPRDSSTSIGGEAAELVNVPSRDRIQEAFRAAAKRHHPDLAPSSNQSAIKRSKQTLGSTFQSISKADNTVTFRECHEARELLLDYYVRRKYIHPEIIHSTKNQPSKDLSNESLFSVWIENRSFQLEVFLRLSLCLGLAVGTYFHDKHTPERRRQQILKRDQQFYQFGPQAR